MALTKLYTLKYTLYKPCYAYFTIICKICFKENKDKPEDLTEGR